MNKSIIPNLFTSANLAFGVLGITFSATFIDFVELSITAPKIFREKLSIIKCIQTLSPSSHFTIVLSIWSF